MSECSWSHCSNAARTRSGLPSKKLKKKSECKFQVLCSLEVKKERSAGYKTLCEALCVVKRDLPAEKIETYTLSLPSTMLQCGGASQYAKCIPWFPILKMKAWNITYTIRHESEITTCQIEISSWKSVWKFNLFSSTRLMETHLICILFPPPCISKIHFKFPSLPFPQRPPDIFLAVPTLPNAQV